MTPTPNCHKPVESKAESSRTARDRLLDAAYELFSRYGIRATGIDAILSASGVARVALYLHFKPKMNGY